MFAATLLFLHPYLSHICFLHQLIHPPFPEVFVVSQSHPGTHPHCFVSNTYSLWIFHKTQTQHCNSESGGTVTSFKTVHLSPQHNTCKHLHDLHKYKCCQVKTFYSKQTCFFNRSWCIFKFAQSHEWAADFPQPSQWQHWYSKLLTINIGIMSLACAPVHLGTSVHT